MQVIKRDGKIVDYDRAKIKIAIEKANKEVVTEEEGNLLDIVIEDKISKVEEEELKPIEFEVPNQNIHIENEIKKYAAEKPQQVADIVKSWLVESER